jgi:hypothetical protein
MGTHDELLSRRMPPHADYPTRRSSPLSRPGKPRQWHTWQPTIWVLRRTRLGPSPPLHPPVRLRRRIRERESQRERLPTEVRELVLDDQQSRSRICWNAFGD